MREKTREDRPRPASYKPISFKLKCCPLRSLARSRIHVVIVMCGETICTRSFSSSRGREPFNFHCLIIVIYSQLLIIMAKLQLPENGRTEARGPTAVDRANVYRLQKEKKTHPVVMVEVCNVG